MDLPKLAVVVFLTAIAPTMGSSPNDLLTLTPSSAEISHFVNSSFIVFCRCKRTDIRIQWYSPLGIIIDNVKGRVHIEEKPGQLALVLEHIALIDKGTWSCRTTGTDDPHQKSFELLVNQRISFEDGESGTVQSVRENRDATIFCKVNGDPKPTVSWYRNGDPIKFPNGKFKKLSDALFIKDVTQSDDGEYTCRAYQISATVTDVQDRTILLRIQHKPFWASNEITSDYFAYVGGFANISCGAIAEPPASFTWIYDSKSITSSPKSNYRIFRTDNSSVLQIRVSNETQFGDYKCKVANPLGTLERTMQLKKGQKPVAPSRFQKRRLYTDALELDIRSVKYTNIPENMKTKGYQVEYMTENDFKYAAGNWSFADRKNFYFSEGVRFMISGLEKNTTYYMRAATMNIAGLSDWTKVVILTTLANSARRALELTTEVSIILALGLAIRHLQMF